MHAGAHHRGCAPDELRRIPPLRERRARRRAVAAAHAERPLRLGEHDAPQRAGGDEVARADIGRVLAQVEGHAERDASAAARLQHSHGVGDRRGHRLLAQHVLTGFRRLDDVLGMEGIRRAHEDAVDARVLEEVAKPTVRGACAVRLRERLRAALITAVDADELAAAGHGHRRRDLDVWMLARGDDAPSERHGFLPVASVVEPPVKSRTVLTRVAADVLARGHRDQAGRFAFRNVRTCRTASGIFSFVSFHGKKVSSDFGASIADSMAGS